MQAKSTYSHAQSPLLKRMLYFIQWVMFCFVYWVLFSQSKGKWLFSRGTTLWCGWKPLHALVAAAQTGWAKRMWALRGFLREGLLWSGLGPLQEQKENHFCHKQITSWLFFFSKEVDCVELRDTRDCSEPAPAHWLFSGWPLISQHRKLLSKPLRVWQMRGWFAHNAQRCFADKQ